MKTKSNEIKQAVATLNKEGFTIPQELATQITSLDNPLYRIAVAGMYQVGKSTLINKVFLDDKHLLKEGRGLCTTAVATELEYGPEKLEVFHWTSDGETLVQSINNPTADDVDKATATPTMDDRKTLAKKVSRVRLTIPNAALRNYTIIDTPGLDDPEPDLLLNTTYRVIPSADIALIVVECRMLSDIELKLLSQDVAGKNGIQRMMVLVSCKPKNGQDEETRKDILNTIKEQLVSIGQPSIPVEMYCYDSSITDIMSDIPEIRLTIRSFLEQNAQQGREEKIIDLLTREISKNLNEIAAKIKAATTNTEEKKVLSAKVEAEIVKFKAKAEMSFDRFKDDIQRFQHDSREDANQAVDEVFDNFLNDLKIADDLSVMQKLVNNAEPRLKTELADKLSLLSLTLESDFNQLIARYQDEIAQGSLNIDELMNKEIYIDKPISAKVPKFVITIGNLGLIYLIFGFGPLGWIAGLISLFAGNPLNFMAKKLLMSQVSKNIENTKVDIKAQIGQKIDDCITVAYKKVKAQVEKYNQEKVATLRLAVEDSSETVDSAKLEQTKKALENALASL